MVSMNDDEAIKDELVRKDVHVLSARLYDLRERFMKIIQKMNNDAIGFEGQLSSEEDQTTEEESNEEMSADEEDAASSNDSDEENGTAKSKIRVKMKKLLIESILRRKSRHREYLRHISQYPKIVKYLINDNPNSINIPLRHLEPFIRKHVNTSPNGQIYDEIIHQLQDIRRNYLKNYH